MSSTQNSQNLLVNVLRPVYTYSSETGFTAGVVATNLKAVNTDAITAGVAQFGDTGGNIYLGSNAGNTTVGTNSNNVAFGVGAASGINGVQNSVFIGASAGQGISNASNDVVIGAGTSVVGSRNIVIGNNDLVTGSNNFVIASDTILTGSYKVNIGNLIQGDISAKTLSFTTGTDISGGGYFGGNVGIRYPNPTHSLDVSGSIYATSNVILSDGSQNRPSLTFANDASAGIFRDASGNVGFARAGRYAMKLDPSGSVLYTDLTVEGTLACATFDAGGIATTNLAVPGYIRNNDLTFVTDISQGNFSFTGTGRSRVANITFSNTRINASGGIAGTNFDLSSGNLILSNNVVAGGLFSNTATNTSNYLGGVYLVDNEVRPSRLLEKGTGAFDLCSNGLSLIGKITGGDDTQSNRIGGIILSNSNAIVPGFIRNALTPTTLNISGGNISNSGNTLSSNFTTITASSNNIGGVVLNATNVSNVGTLGTTNALVSGYLRNALTPSTLDISGGNIAYSGAISNSVINQSNTIGGVTLSNGYMRSGPGTVNAPGVSFLTDTSMGLYRVGTQALGISVGGVNRMTICGDKIGIGTTTPSYRFEVSNSETTNNDVRITGGAGNVANSGGALAFSAGQGGASGFMSRIKGVLCNAIVGTEEQGGIIFETRASNASSGQALTERVRIDANGRVGIGSTAPVETLDVCGNLIVGGGVDSNLIRFRGTTGDSNSAGDFTVMAERIWGGSEQSELIIFKGNDVGASGPDRIRYRSTQHVFQTSGSEAWTGLQDNNTRMVIMNDGNVGIGTTSPAYPLDVTGNARTSTLITTNLYPVSSSDVSAIAYIRMSGGDFSNLPFLWFRQGGGPARYSGINFGSFNTNSMYFYNANGTLRVKSMDTLATSQSQLDSCASILSINQSGKVGIGVESPMALLDIGKIGTNGGLQIYGLSNNNITRPVIDSCANFPTNTPAYEIRSATVNGADGFLRIRAGGNGGGGGPWPNYASYIDLTGFSTLTDMFNNIVLGTAGTERMRIDSNGRIGIRTSAPASLLHLSDTSDVSFGNVTLTMQTGGVKRGQSNVIAFTGTDSGVSTGVLSSIAGIDTATGTQGYRGDISFRTTNGANNTLERMRIQYDGRVGIGTSAPSTMLDISASSGGIKVGSSGTGYLTIGTAGVASEYANLSMNGYFTLNKVATTNQPMVSFPSDPDVATGGFIFMSNKVGIGTTTPAYSLDISAGNTANTLRVQATSYPSVLLSTPTSAGSGQVLFDGVGSKYILRASAVPLVFENPGNTERMRIGTDGNVGIGTATPAYKLDVAATAGAAAVNMNTWPRANVSNVCIVRGITGCIGNSYNFSNNVQNTIDTNLMTVVHSNATNGASFKFLKSGVWAITFTGSNSAGTSIHWMDVSTNDSSNVGQYTAGAPVIAIVQTTNHFTLHWSGWLPGSSTNFYKLRTNNQTTPGTGNNYYFQAMLLYETPNSAGTFPY